MKGTSLAAEFLARLRAFVRRRVRSDADADDVVQDVTYKLVRQGDGKGSVHSWLFTVARHAIIDRHRSR
jgi:RNA polymerase sigma factor (sigma-70 family)